MKGWRCEAKRITSLSRSAGFATWCDRSNCRDCSCCAIPTYSIIAGCGIQLLHGRRKHVVHRVGADYFSRILSSFLLSYSAAAPLRKTLTLTFFSKSYSPRVSVLFGDLMGFRHAGGTTPGRPALQESCALDENLLENVVDVSVGFVGVYLNPAVALDDAGQE